MSKYKPKSNHPNALKYRKDIEKRIVEGIDNNLTITAILDSISHMNEAPQSSSGLYKIYGPAIEEARYRNQTYIGGALRRKVQEGDAKIIEFLARTKMGLNPTTQVKEVEEGEENKDAISRLAQLLGKEKPDEEQS
jgi:hypothetical protein